MSFFPLPHKATTQHRIQAPARNRAGQVVLATEYEPTTTDFRCLFYGYMGGKNAAGREDYDQTAALYCEGNVDIREGDRITNVRGKGLVESGPFEVLKVTRVTNFSGGVHHLSCKVRGGAGVT